MCVCLVGWNIWGVIGVIHIACSCMRGCIRCVRAFVCVGYSSLLRCLPVTYRSNHICCLFIYSYIYTYIYICIHTYLYVYLYFTFSSQKSRLNFMLHIFFYIRNNFCVWVECFVLDVFVFWWLVIRRMRTLDETSSTHRAPIHVFRIPHACIYSIPITID